MAKAQARPGFVPHVEALEARQTPSTTVINNNFDSTWVGNLPSGWAQWNTAGGFAVSTLHPYSGTHSLTDSGPSSDVARAWLTTWLQADAQASANVYVNSLVPGLVFLRGTNLNTADPSFYALYIRQGFYVQLLKVVNGQTTVLG